MVKDVTSGLALVTVLSDKTNRLHDAGPIIG